MYRFFIIHHYIYPYTSLYFSDMIGLIMMTAEILKALYLLSLYTEKLDPGGVQFAFHCLEHKDTQIVISAGYILVDMADIEVMNELLLRLPTYPVPTQKILIAILCTSLLSAPYIYLLDALATYSQELANFTIQCLSATDYPIASLIFPRMDTRHKKYLDRLCELIQKMGLKKLEIALAIFPVIPHELTFRRLFGDEAIDALIS